MYEDFAPKLATVLTEYSMPIEKGQLVVIQAPIVATPLIEALYEAILKRGAHPHIETGTPNAADIFFKYANDDQLTYVDPIGMKTVEVGDAFFYILAPTNPKRMSGVAPERLAKNQEADRPYLEVFKRREDAGELRWNIAPWVTPAAAQEAEMSLLDYTEFVYKACALDQPDPVAYWMNFRDAQQRLIEWLKGKKHAEVRGPGIEMTFDFDGRAWVNCYGKVNFPDGEIFTSPIENSVNGHVEFNFPANYGGRDVDGVKLTFKDGEVVEASAQKGEDFLLSQIKLDAGAKILGEFAVGTNMGIQRYTRSVLFDEKIGGTIHMALGRGFTEAGGSNMSVLHWDMVHGMRAGGEIYIDGELFYQNGAFVVG